tara:strand:+ start:8391 stop:10322 length:1932 start_codon:yes stop_codon:yes gene_type:complete
MASEKQAERLKLAQDLANDAIESGNELYRDLGRLLQGRISQTKTLGEVNKQIMHNLSRQLQAEKRGLSNDEKRKGLATSLAYAKASMNKLEQKGKGNIAEQLKLVVQLLEVEEASLDKAERKNEVFDQLVEKAKDLRNKLTIAALFTGITTAAFKFAARIDKIGETFGSLNVLGKDFQTDLLASSVEATKLGGGLEDVANITNALASDFGMSVDQAAQLSGKVFDTSKAIGLSAEEGANLFGVLTQTANLSAEQAESLAEGTFQLARQAGVAPNAVLKDLAGSAEEIALFTEDGGDNIAEAAVQARRLGLSLSTTAKISEGLLDFESSIRAEQEASVLIGRQLNLQRARELALQNDIAGATKEVVAQLGSEAEFTRMNALERQALAKSIGVSVSELSKLVGQSDKLSLSGSLAAGNFEDLLGQEGLSNLSSIIGEFKALGAELVNSLGPALETAVGSFRDFLKEGGGLEKISSIITSLGKGFEVVAGSLPTVIGLFVALKSVSIGAAIASAMAATSAVAAATLGIGVPVLLGVLAAAATKIAQFTTVDDFKSGPGGINFMSGPAGAFKLNPRDSVLATTNPIQVNDMMSGPPGSLGGGGTNVQISSKMVKLGGGDLGLAIDAFTYPANTGQGRSKFESLVGRG